MRKSIFSAVGAAAMAAAMVAFAASAQTGTGSAVAGSFTDSRDGKTYKTVTIGAQTWFAENLNYAGDNSRGACYNNKESNCAKYGRLYSWAAAKETCPEGWRLPSDAEWTKLTDNVGGAPIAGKKFKTKTGWYNNGNGTNESKFYALPGGDGYRDTSFYDEGGSGYWWSATERDHRRAWYRSIRCDYDGVGRGYDLKTNLYSVRCVQDHE